MKLYFSPGACSLSPNIVARELGIPLELVKVDLKAKLYGDGQDFRKVNAKGYVPALELDDGRVLTEGPAIVQYLADLKPEAGLVPGWGTFERYRLLEKLNFVTSELHKSIGSLFNAAMPAEWQQATRDRIKDRLGQLESDIGDAPYLMGERFSVVDAYCYTVLNWLRAFKMELAPWPKLARYMERLRERESVRTAMAAEKGEGGKA